MTPMLSRNRRRQQVRTKASVNDDAEIKATEARIDEYNDAAEQRMLVPPIYSAPTVDSLGDTDSLIRPFGTSNPLTTSSHVLNPDVISSRSEYSLSTGSLSNKYNRNYTNAESNLNVNIGRNAPNKHRQSKSSRRIISSRTKGAKKTTSQSQQGFVHDHLGRRRRFHHERDFQYEKDAMTVTVRSVNVAQRSAFECSPLLMGFSRFDKKKVSPSQQFCDLLVSMQNIRQIRQLVFSASVHWKSDFFVSWDNEFLEEDGTTDNKKRQRKKIFRDGRYRSIDPIKATVAALASTPPALSNKKRRLPMRSDVGFPNPSEREIEQKLKEIQLETEWEEASPRLIVLVTSDDLGTATHEAVPPRHTLSDHLKWNGGGLVGMPWAGPELLMTNERNGKHFSRSSAGRLGKKFQQKKTSMLAPPLDSTYSSTLGWRPRPFHDRPTCRKYFIVCPVDIHFGAGEIEPLLGSLALYTLPTKGKKPGEVYGKISEEFWFPAGDWRKKVQLDVFANGELTTDEHIIRDWHHRKHKGVFSYDPFEISGGTESLYIVLQIYKVAQADAAAAYVGSHDKKDNRSHMTMPLDNRKKGKRSKKTAKYNSNSTDAADATQRANRIFRNCGTKFMTHLAYGLLPLISLDETVSNIKDGDAEVTWPKGENRNLQLFFPPSMPESQDDFVERLTSTVKHSCHSTQDANESACDIGNNLSCEMSSFSEHSNSISPSILTTASSNSNSDISTPKKKKKSVRRLLMSPLKSSHSHYSQAASSNSRKNHNHKSESAFKPMSASGKIFISFLKTDDFLQSMLQESPLLGEYHSYLLKKYMVDVSGDFAVVLDTASQHKIPPGTLRKRSDLVRLPAHSQPAGYVKASEFREVMYLPLRSDKQYDFDVMPCNRSLLNVLYLLPKLLLCNAEQIYSRYTVRISLIQCDIDYLDETGNLAPSGSTLNSFHSRAPWAGPSLVSDAYTTVPIQYPENKTDFDYTKGIALQDEFKLRLPIVLDGTYHLRFTLFAIDLPKYSSTGDDVYLKCLAETTIPLSSSSQRDSTNARVTTVISNGCHRIKLGDFTLHLETRLVSTIHIGDTAAVAAIRDFPFAKEGDIHSLLAQNYSGASSKIEDYIWASGSPASLFTSVSENVLIGNFQLLLYMHLCNLINLKNCSKPNVAKFMLRSMHSLFEIIRKIKLRFLTSPSRDKKMRLEIFLKNIVDTFEEDLLLSTSRSNSFDNENRFEASPEALYPDGAHSSSAGNSQDENFEEDDMDEGAVRIRRKDSLRNDIDIRLTRTKDSTISPFSRVAYGASKIDRMRIEAELYNDSNRYTHLFDDDETVVTAATGLYTTIETLKPELKESFKGEGIWGIREERNAEDTSENSIRSSFSLPADSENQQQPVSFGESGFAKRVKTAAQVMLAPCVGPSLHTILTIGSSSPRRSKFDGSHFFYGSNSVLSTEKILPNAAPEKDDSMETTTPADCFCSAGSDAEESPSDTDEGHQQVYATFRGPSDGPLLEFSIEEDEHDFTVKSGKHLYESVMVLWLRAWLDEVKGSLSQKSMETSSFMCQEEATFPIPEFNHSKTTTKSSVFTFYAHMDLLLPLCLKSIALRYGVEVQPDYAPGTRVIADEGHLRVLLPFVEILARGVMGQTLSVKSSSSFTAEESDASLFRALSSSELVLDFLIGLLTIFHPENMRLLIEKYFRTLRHCETEYFDKRTTNRDFKWSDCSLHRVRCSRQLRLRAIETFAVLPNYLAINYPMKYHDLPRRVGVQKPTWKKQYFKDTEYETLLSQSHTPTDGSGYLPSSGWLANILVSEGFSICSLSCEAVVAEAMSYMEEEASKNTLKKRSTTQLKRVDLLMFQSLAIHAITCIYELVLRRHAMDKRFQTESCRGRIASLTIETIFDRSLASVRWLARMESTHKVRSLWLLCFVYVLQEAPESLLRSLLRSYCDAKGIRIHRFIRLLRLSSSTFQSFVDQARHSTFPSEIDKGMSPWLLQESFNTVCATTNIVVEECVNLRFNNLREHLKMMQGVLDLLLHVLTTPQSSVTHLRAIGGSLQALDQFGVELFLEVAGGSLQFWIRVILSLMNSTALSVRSIAVDFVVSLLGSAYDLMGNIDEILIVFVTVLPEVTAREIALYCVSAHISVTTDVERAVWPLRRSLADLDDANPLDDDRVDPQLSPILSMFCRACQAAIDGVLIELRLQDKWAVVSARVKIPSVHVYTFDADEESLFEVADFFVAETAPMQKIRWLLTLKSLHEAKGQWIEAAETLFMIARALSDSIPHLKNVWRPSRFVLWSDKRRSLWLSTVGEEIGSFDHGNTEVMDFADEFLEPSDILKTSAKLSTSGKLHQPTIPDMCKMLSNVAKEAVAFYLREDGMDGVAYSRLESLLKTVINVIDEQDSLATECGSSRVLNITERKRQMEDETALRRVSASLSGDMTKLAERLLLFVQDEPGAIVDKHKDEEPTAEIACQQYYVRILLAGKKPPRFEESTSLPTFLELNVPCICRVPKGFVDKAMKRARGNPSMMEEYLCAEFGQPLYDALVKTCSVDLITFGTGRGTERCQHEKSLEKSHLDVSLVQMDFPGTEINHQNQNSMGLQSKRFFHKKSGPTANVLSSLVELTVAQRFPCALSRQRSLLTSEFLSSIPGYVDE